MLEVRGIEVFYGEFLAIKGISFTVGEGELVTIIGANGAGKSTILRAVAKERSSSVEKIFL
jgi:branched-chain amino acid transport system ATP-binding protein